MSKTELIIQLIKIGLGVFGLSILLVILLT